MDGVKKVMSPEQFDRLASGYERYSVLSGEQTQDDKGMLVELNDALAREAALREAYKGYSSKLVVDALNAELCALREELATSNKVGTAIGETLGRVTAERDDLHKRLTAAEQRNAELERDAERYRWLRNPEQRDCVPPELDVICGVAEGNDVLWFEQLDRAIDAAMAVKP